MSSNSKTDEVRRHEQWGLHAHTCTCAGGGEWENPLALQRRSILAAPACSKRFRSWAEEEHYPLLAAVISGKPSFFSLLSPSVRFCPRFDGNDRIKTELHEEEKYKPGRKTQSRKRSPQRDSPLALSALRFTLITYLPFLPQYLPCAMWSVY